MGTQLMREIEDVAIPELLLAYHGERQHMLTRHMDVSLIELRNRLRHIHVEKDEIMKASRFLSNSLAEVCTYVHTCLLQNQAKVEKWMRTGRLGKLDISCTFDHPVGECIALNTNWKDTFQESQLVVVLGESDIPGRIFQILTAYPEATPDEIDLIYDAMDQWLLHRK
uniref:RNase A-like domain-containing protein n=1 Tax=Lachnoclostridium phocaeense TaxID=1871021 RepID=UPI0026DAD7CE|nr:RNase A-like domain-containing protein [Lachnoclostridium phocaeense]